MMNLNLKPFAIFALLVLGTFSCLDKAKFIASDAGSTDVKTDIVERDVRDKIDMPDMTVRTECEKCEDGEVCDSSDFECVDCIDSDSECDGQVCKSETRTCVACLDNSSCTDVTLSMCSQKNECIECEVGMDACGHLSATPRCNAGKCEAGCEQDSHCTGTDICDLTTNACTTKVAGEASQCEECVSDSHCEIGSHCVPSFYRGRFYGNYCLQLRPGTGCTPPFVGLISDRESLGGEIGNTYCGVNEDEATCDVVLDLGTDCSNNDGTLADVTKCINHPSARCAGGPNSWRCTYDCLSQEECTDVCGIEFCSTP